MRYWAEKGTPVHKLNMGFATYGRTFRLSTQSSQVGAPASSPAAAGTFTREPGIWSYYEVKRNPHSHINMFILSQFLCLSSRSMLICQVTTQNAFFICFQICTFLQGASVHLIEDQKVPYATKQNEWVGYDNKESFMTKVDMCIWMLLSFSLPDNISTKTTYHIKMCILLLSCFDCYCFRSVT